MIGNKNLLDPIVSGTQPSPESIALLFSQLSPFVITTIYMKGGGDTRVSAVRRPNGSLIIRQVQIDPAFLSSGARPIVSGAIYCDGLLGALIIGSASS